LGATTISTNFRGVAVGFTVPLGQSIAASVTSTPSNYKTNSSSSKTVFVNQSGKISLGVTKIVTHVCTHGEKRYPTTCDDGTTIYREVCENNRWVPTGAKCEAKKGENAIITNVQYPPTAHEGDEFNVVVTTKNVGTETCELRAVLKNYEDKKIDTTPEERLKLFTSVAPGAKKDFTLSTKSSVSDIRWKMPGYDWDLKVEIAEIDKNWGSVQKVHDSKKITVELYREGEERTDYEPWKDEDPHQGEDEPDIDPDTGLPYGECGLTVVVPTLVLAGEREITGTAPSANTRVEIMAKRKFIGFDFLAADTPISSAVSKPDGTFATTIELEEFGGVEIYAKIRKEWKPPEWLARLGMAPVDWMAADTTSEKHTVLVLTPMILLALLAMLAMVLDKKYNFIGIMKKKRGKK